mgnify:FL=1|tara:strand:+ start:73 stop:288 length:216 start_codon:yes stop_codon:yes gene_type:complete
MKRGDLVKRKSAYRHSLGGAMNSQVVSEYVGIKWGIILRVYDNDKIDVYLNDGILTSRSRCDHYEVISEHR